MRGDPIPLQNEYVEGQRLRLVRRDANLAHCLKLKTNNLNFASC